MIAEVSTIPLYSILGGVLRNCLLMIKGNDNTIEIGADTSITNGVLWIEDNNNKIKIGNNTAITGNTHLACIEGCKISIGDNCLFSSDIVIRTGDSHSILDMNGDRINPSKDVIISDHIWVGSKVTINKGVTIAENNMIGTGAIITKSMNETNTIIAGIPAKVVKHGVNWCGERIKMKTEKT